MFFCWQGNVKNPGIPKLVIFSGFPVKTWKDSVVWLRIFNWQIQGTVIFTVLDLQGLWIYFRRGNGRNGTWRFTPPKKLTCPQEETKEMPKTVSSKEGRLKHIETRHQMDPSSIALAGLGVALGKKGVYRVVSFGGGAHYKIRTPTTFPKSYWLFWPQIYRCEFCRGYAATSASRKIPSQELSFLFKWHCSKWQLVRKIPVFSTWPRFHLQVFNVWFKHVKSKTY